MKIFSLRPHVPGNALLERACVRSVVFSVLTLFLSSMAPMVRAAATPPEFMTYQGFLVDGNGGPLATNLPANYPVIFRIFSAASAGERLWSEQQIVTVDKGNFSVVLGEGTMVGGEVRPPLSSVFAGATASDRYISISVTIGSSTMEILPRLRLLPAPYAFLATSASSVVTPAGSNAVRYANNRVEIDSNVRVSGSGFPALTLESPTTAGTWLALGNSSAGGRYWQLISSGSANGGGAGNLVLGSGTSPGATTINPLVIQPDGDVGFGTLTPNAQISLGNNLANTKIAVWDGGPGSAFGLGIQGGQFRFHVNGGSDRFTFLNGPAGTELVNIQGSGNFGIGVNPARRFHVSTPDAIVARLDSSSVIGTWLTLGNSTTGGRFWQIISTGSGNGEGAGKLLINSGASDGGTTGSKMVFQDNGNIGIAVVNPLDRLQIGETNLPGDQYLSIKSAGGNAYRTGIKFRHFTDNGGFTIEDDERGGVNGLNFVRHPYGAGVSAMFVDRFNGSVGLGTTTPADKLHLRGGTLRIDDGGSRYIQMFRSVNGFIIAGNSMSQQGGGNGTIQWDGDGNWDSLSDRRLKKDITDAEPVMDRVMQMPVRRYRWKEGAEDSPKKFGVIAQEVQPLFPEAVGLMTQPGASEESLTVKYGAFGLIAVKALQELKAEKDTEQAAMRQQIKELRQEVASLKAQVSKSARVEVLEEELSGLKEMVQRLAAREPSEAGSRIGAGNLTPVRQVSSTGADSSTAAR